MARHWYRVDLVEAKETRVLVGTSELDPAQLVRHLRSGEYLELSDLSYRDNQNRFLSWTNWDPRLAAVAYVNPQYVTCVMPFAGDPRETAASVPQR